MQMVRPVNGYVDGSLKEICSRVDSGIAEDSFRLLWAGLGEWFRLTWPAGERPRKP